MANVWSRDIRIAFAGYNLGTATTSVSLMLEVAAGDVTAFGDAGERATAGLRQDKAEWAGLFNDSVSMDAAAAAMIGTGTSNVLSVSFATGSNALSYAGTAILIAAKPVVSVKDFVRQEVEFKMDGTLDKGRAHIVVGTLAGAAQSGSVDNSAATTGGGRWYVQLFAQTGAGTGTLTLQHSTDGTSFVAASTLNAVGTRNSYISSVAGTINRYTRVDLSNYAGTNITLTSIIARA